MRVFAIVVFAVLALFVATPARADRVPDSALQMRVVSRDSESFVIELTNPSDDAAQFNPIGLYFLPNDGEGEQRLGVVTAGEISVPSAGFVAGNDVVDVAAHRSVVMRLTAYCIDQTRESPKTTTTFHLALRRMPTALTVALAGAARTVETVGYDPESAPRDMRPVSLSASLSVALSGRHDQIQRAVWRVRAAMPTALIGDGHVEK